MIRSKLGSLLVLALALLPVLPRVASAAQNYDSCTGFILSVPAVITTPGTWCLKQNLSTAMASGNAIDIQANHVTIDCNDFALDGSAAGSTTAAIGIYANNRVNATARRCNVRGFYIGIGFGGGSGWGHLVEDNRLDGNTNTGVLAIGDGSIVRRNQIFRTGGSPGSGATGIAINYSVDVLDNTVSGVTATSGSNGYVMGISTQTSTGGTLIIGNRVRGLQADGTGQARGFSALMAQPIVLRDNAFAGDGAVGSIAMSCLSAAGHSKENQISGFANGVSGCSDDGGNYFAP